MNDAEPETTYERCFVAYDGHGMFRVFSYADFDEYGNYMGYDVPTCYHIDDLHIIADFDSYEDAAFFLQNMK